VKKDQACPCNPLRSYAACCKLLIKGELRAKTAEQLMRSRYSAFAKGCIDYLVSTLHPSKRKANEAEQLAANVKLYQWLELKVIGTKRGAESDSEGTVEFCAYYQGLDSGQLHECSRFIKEAGRWYYLDGDIKDQRKLKRNDRCWCQSGKKFKKCHG
jgi:SEC-C motif domain protein